MNIKTKSALGDLIKALEIDSTVSQKDINTMKEAIDLFVLRPLEKNRI